MALDHSEAVDRIAVLDIAPTATMYARTNKEFATRYFWWFFLIQPAPLPERLIGADPEFFLRKHIEGQATRQARSARACSGSTCAAIAIRRRRHAICEDYRAAAWIDLDHDAADVDAQIMVPLLTLWGAKGTVGQLYDVLETWREKAIDVSRQGARLRPHAARRGAGGNLARVVGLPNLSENRVRSPRGAFAAVVSLKRFYTTHHCWNHPGSFAEWQSTKQVIAGGEASQDLVQRG